MTHAVTLLLGVHAHQPVGNFPEVIEDAHRRCYKPFLETLHAYPDFRFAAHFSGWLLDWLRERFPAEMVARGQVELFSSGDTEPVLATIPQRDRVGQLRTLNDKLEKWTGVRPGGAWLTERVWESSVVPALAETGIAYVTVDDYHFFCTGKAADELDCFFSTEEDGTRLDLFPISEALRYRLPFSPAHEVIGYLESLADQGHAAAIYFDDIKKFGIWPETYGWVYHRGWLKALIEGVLASPKIRTATYADFHASHATRGIVYLPTTSYSEMNEWTLPMPAAGIYANLLAGEKAAGRADLHRPFIRGGIWRNFLTSYPEANWMHKRMQALSARLAALPAAPAELTADLYRAQANDAYWHGLFGGLYLPHLRRAVWNNIVALEAGLDALQPRPALAAVDLDFDGKRETFAHDRQVQLVLHDDGLGAAHELSSYPLRHNFGDTLPRVLWLDALDGVALTDYVQETPTGLRFSCPGLVKTYALSGSTVTVTWHCSGLAGRHLTTRLDLAMPSCDGFLGRYVLADGSIPGGFGTPLALPATTALTLEDGVLGGSIRLLASLSGEISGRPQQTVSQSEAGFEKIMQGVELTFQWTVPDDDHTLQLQLQLQLTIQANAS